MKRKSKFDNSKMKEARIPKVFGLVIAFVPLTFLAINLWSHGKLAELQNSRVGSFVIVEQRNSNDVHDAYNDTQPWSHPIIHVVSTRFMQGQANLKNLTLARLQLFETFCLPTIVGQELTKAFANQDDGDPSFLWIINVDPNLDHTIIDRMVSLLRPYPNFYLVGSNDNIGRWKSKIVGEQIIQGRVELYAGDLKFLTRAFRYRTERIVVDTRLDSDDGLSIFYLQNIQRMALENLSFHNNAQNSTKAIWSAWCSEKNIDWLPIEDKAVGVFLPRMNYHVCITPGLSIGISVGVSDDQVPTFPHTKLLSEGRAQGCGLQNRIKCVQLISDPHTLAIRARTLTSTGMSSVSFQGNQMKNVWREKHLLSMVVKEFHISQKAIQKANTYFKHHLLDIVRDNLKGNQCTKGHSCKISSKEKLQRIVDQVEGKSLGLRTISD